MVDGVQRLVVSPLQVVQHQHQGLLRGLQPQVLGPGMQAAGAQLLAVTQDASNEGAGAVVQADQLAQQRRLFVCCRAEDRRQRGRELLLRLRLRVAVLHAVVPEQQVAQQAARLVQALGVAAGGPQRSGARGRQQIGPHFGQHFGQQPALAQPRLAH